MRSRGFSAFAWQDAGDCCRDTLLGGYFYFILLKKGKDKQKMKTVLRITVATVLAMAVAVSLCSCAKTIDTKALWENATYGEDTAFGTGEKTVTVEVKAGERSVTFTIHTDKDTVGEALFEHNLIDGDEGAYGLYVKVVNGITADYDTDQSYWAFYINGETAMTGVDGATITEGETYRLEYEK